MNHLLISGASAGIGAATAERFLADGYRVLNLSRRPCPVAGVDHLPCDLSEPDFPARVGDAIAERLAGAARVVLVHNAARMENDTARDTSSQQLRAVLETNLVAANSLNLLCLPHMGPGSAIVYVGSTLAEKAVPGTFSYVVSKHAMVGMMRATCQDLAGRGIHTVCVCPGFTDTDMLRTHVPAAALPAVQAMSAYNRLIEPAEIADAICWAAASPVINGAVIHANLGQVER
jgi:3-oxoacyl-[acyl-carrier protein] reductase